MALFISYIKMFSSSNLYSFVPLFPKNRLMFPCSLRYFANVPLFPQPLGDPQCRELKLNPLTTQINIYCLMTNQTPELLVQRTS